MTCARSLLNFLIILHAFEPEVTRWPLESRISSQMRMLSCVLLQLYVALDIIPICISHALPVPR